MFQREVIGNVGGKPAYGNAVGVVNSFWRTSEIRAGIILGRIIQRDLLDEWECCRRSEGLFGNDLSGNDSVCDALTRCRVLS